MSTGTMRNALTKSFDGSDTDEWFKWLPVGIGLVAMYAPSYRDIAKIFWSSEVGAHGPIILGILVWLFWRKREALIDRGETPWPGLGWALVATGWLFYVIGRSQEFYQLEIGSQIPLLLGLLLALRGPKAVRACWFAVFFICFLIPIPNSLLDAILLPLKKYVSVVAELVLYSAGYPVARNGVVLTIGPYQLLIANACSGLNSMIALSGVGLLFAYLMSGNRRLHTALLLVAILPIAFLANLVRVLLLMVVTFHYGDDAGRAFHDSAGYLEIVFAFGAFFGLDWLAGRVFSSNTQPPRLGGTEEATS